jgi:pimeloyl-ACP methyl ester carboxylesterase
MGKGNEYIVVMHEWMGDCSNYDSILPYINRHDFQWIFIDFRGYGLSKNISGAFSLEEASADVIALLNDLNISHAHFLGHSMSSLIAQYIALTYNTYVKSLLLVTPIAPTGIKMKEEAKRKLLNDVAQENGRIESVVEASSKRYNKVWKDYRIDLAHNCSTLEAKLGYMNMYLSNDFSQEIQGLNLPVRVIVGQYDLPAFHKSVVQKQFTQYYSDLQIILCEEAGHYPMIECPVFFANKIETFIRTLS